MDMCTSRAQVFGTSASCQISHLPSQYLVVRLTTATMSAEAASRNGSALSDGGISEAGVVGVDVALGANDMESVPTVLQAIAAAGEQLSADDSVTRLALLDRARELVRALERDHDQASMG
jgi:hypothetical protein